MNSTLNFTFVVIIASTCVSALALDNGVGQKPALGLNLWNAYQCFVDEDIVQRVADTLVSSGLSKYYTYLNVDDVSCFKGRGN